ncbi:hypothetical protein ANCDUO_16642, partial [Ancylostoma duodenale]
MSLLIAPGIDKKMIGSSRLGDGRCGRNEVFDACGSACEPTCRNPNPVSKGTAPPRPPPPRPPTAASCSEVRCPAGYHCEMVEFPCTRQPCATPSPRCVPD